MAMASTPACHFQPKAATMAALPGREDVDEVGDLREFRAVTASTYLKQAAGGNSEKMILPRQISSAIIGEIIVAKGPLQITDGRA